MCIATAESQRKVWSIKIHVLKKTSKYEQEMPQSQTSPRHHEEETVAGTAVYSKAVILLLVFTGL